MVILGVEMPEERYYASFDERVFLDEVVQLTFTPRDANGTGGAEYTAETDEVWLKTDPEGITRKFCLFRPDRVFWFDPIASAWSPWHAGLSRKSTSH